MLIAILLAAAQFDCPAEGSVPWLSRTSEAASPAAIIPNSLVHRVRSDMRDEAKLRLAEVTFVELKPDEVGRFMGDRIAMPTQNEPSGIKPYLVRAVLANPGAIFQVGWSGTRLIVDTGGMGCFRYVEEPLVVWLDRTPSVVLSFAYSDM